MKDTTYTGSMEPKEKLVWIAWFAVIAVSCIVLYFINALALAAHLPNQL